MDELPPRLIFIRGQDGLRFGPECCDASLTRFEQCRGRSLHPCGKAELLGEIRQRALLHDEGIHSQSLQGFGRNLRRDSRMPIAISSDPRAKTNLRKLERVRQLRRLKTYPGPCLGESLVQ